MKPVRIICLALIGVAVIAAGTKAQSLIPPATTGASLATEAVGRANVDLAPALNQPSAISAGPNDSPEQLPAGKVAVASLADLEQLAFSNNPAVAQAAARVSALRGKCIQVGLPPNPTAGYLGSEIGQDNTAGQQGGYVGQEFITGSKLSLDRAVVAKEVQQALQNLDATRGRVQTDVRQAYYAAVVAKRRLELANELMNIGAKSVADSTRLKGLGEIAKTDVLPVEIEQRNAQIVAVTARVEQVAAWRRLSSIVGVELPSLDFADDLTKLPELLNYDDQLARLTSTSPEMAMAFAGVGRSEAAVLRARREPVPNLQTTFSVQKDNSTGSTIGGVTVGIPLPIWNRNQGGIMQSEAELAEARRNVSRVEMSLKNRLAFAFQRYAVAHERVKIYADEIVPKAEENFQLSQKAFPAQIGSIEFLIAQRIYFQTKLSYLDALAELWSSWSEIDGLLLTNSLSSPPEIVR